MMRLALGTVQFGLPYGIANQSGQVSRQEAENMLKISVCNGIDTLDTAIAYGDSESCLGEAGVHDFRIVTKLPAIPDDCDDVTTWVQRQFAGSLSRLGVESVYGLLLHRSSQLLDADGPELYRAMRTLKDAGQVRKIGLSIYTPAELDDLVPRYQFDLVQAPFNIVNRQLQTSGWMQRLKDENVEIHTRSAFLQGLLLMERESIPEMFKLRAAVFDTWAEWLAARHLTAVQSCLAYCLSFPEIDRVIVGADNVRQLLQIIEAANGVLAFDYPDIGSDDEYLINPSLWSAL